MITLFYSPHPDNKTFDIQFKGSVTKLPDFLAAIHPCYLIKHTEDERKGLQWTAQWNAEIFRKIILSRLFQKHARRKLQHLSLIDLVTSLIILSNKTEAIEIALDCDTDTLCNLLTEEVCKDNNQTLSVELGFKLYKLGSVVGLWIDHPIKLVENTAKMKIAA